MSAHSLDSDAPREAQGNRCKVVYGYALQQRLGSGSFATVYKGVRVPTANSNDANSTNDSASSSQPEVVAIKAISRTSEKLTKKVLQNLEIEISILRTYQHPNIVCMHNVQKTERHFYLMLEYCGGGDLQHLIRTRKGGRLSEILTRRLMRDLAAGLKFLWGQELIHRDIKPQNLLLTGPLPLDEVDDPDNSPEEQAKRCEANYPSAKFSLKIADFGFARHLQTASLAETLCGSPLYMAPEILQHHRYDAKADLWSVGTVLYEMIVGRPPFNGENHIDLLRNIQRKAVRLPPKVIVSKPCVNLLRLLLNRNPLSRAGFREFFDACDEFVALGCRGVSTVADAGTCRPPGELGTIPENDGTTTSESLMTVATDSHQMNQLSMSPSVPANTQIVSRGSNPPGRFTQPPASQPPVAIPTNPYAAANALTKQYPGRLAPLAPSPPFTAQPSADKYVPAMQPLGTDPRNNWHQPQYSADVVPANKAEMTCSQASTDDSGFVMVEHGNSRMDGMDQAPLIGTNNPSPSYFLAPSTGYAVKPGYVAPRESKGILSTSPGTGGLLMGLVGRSRLRKAPQTTSTNIVEDLAAANKMLATAEDVGRRGVSVAHLGDTRAYIGMRLMHLMENNRSSELSGCTMDEFEEGPRGGSQFGTTGSSVHSNVTEVMATSRRKSAEFEDKDMMDSKYTASEEMPFAVNPETPAVALPSREDSVSIYNRSATSGSKKVPQKVDPLTIRIHFGEALSCYLKALKMLKGAIGAAQRVSKDLETLASQVGNDKLNESNIPTMRHRCEVTSGWLAQQFQGVLERADAAKTEISKLPPVAAGTVVPPVPTVEELIYNHALASGRDGAVKQLLGQYEAARSCYRAAGLLAETILMEGNIGAADRAVLEEYVDGFAARITELDRLMLQQSRSTSGQHSMSMGRGSGVVGLIGPPTGAVPTSLGGV
eukprot:Nitzschia sp. Nitz4//scaffold113_size70149//65767//68656//NITZ4_005964-RA/size70149-augustus-gene-0.87-mRNA-1//1//CDS//3329533383//563//frame0